MLNSKSNFIFWKHTHGYSAKFIIFTFVSLWKHVFIGHTSQSGSLINLRIRQACELIHRGFSLEGQHTSFRNLTILRKWSPSGLFRINRIRNDITVYGNGITRKTANDKTKTIVILVILVNCHPYPSVESFICHLNLFLLIILALLLYLYRRFILWLAVHSRKVPLPVANLWCGTLKAVSKKCVVSYFVATIVGHLWPISRIHSDNLCCSIIS